MYEILQKVYISYFNMYIFHTFWLIYVMYIWKLIKLKKMNNPSRDWKAMVKFWLFCFTIHIIFLQQIIYSIHSFFKLINATEWKERAYLDYILVKGVYVVLFPWSYGIKPMLSMISLFKYAESTYEWNLQPISMS